jgi:dUTP pyrophosphatase
MITVKVINLSNNALPEFQTVHAAGMDICAFLEEPILLKVGQRVLVQTGLFIEIPIGFEVQIRPRSGLAFKHGITVLNSPGTIDADYRGEVKVLLINHGDSDFEIKSGERIAQMILNRHENIVWEPTAILGNTPRGTGGYGSTGK